MKLTQELSLFIGSSRGYFRKDILIKRLMEIVSCTMYQLTEEELNYIIWKDPNREIAIVKEIYGNCIKGFAIADKYYSATYLDLLIFNPEIKKRGLSKKVIEGIVKENYSRYLVVNMDAYGSCRVENIVKSLGKELKGEEIPDWLQEEMERSIKKDNLKVIELNK